MVQCPPDDQDCENLNAYLATVASLPGGDVPVGLFEAGASLISDFTSWWTDKYATGHAFADADGNIALVVLTKHDFYGPFPSDPEDRFTIEMVLLGNAIWQAGLQTQEPVGFGKIRDKALVDALIERMKAAKLPPDLYVRITAALLAGPPGLQYLTELGEISRGPSPADREIRAWIREVPTLTPNPYAAAGALFIDEQFPPKPPPAAEPSAASMGLGARLFLGALTLSAAAAGGLALVRHRRGLRPIPRSLRHPLR